jgi:hypothetical protein
MEEYDKMMVNNLICETLNPENQIARLYNLLPLVSPDKQEFLIKEFNKLSTQENKSNTKKLSYFH